MINLSAQVLTSDAMRIYKPNVLKKAYRAISAQRRQWQQLLVALVRESG